MSPTTTAHPAVPKRGRMAGVTGATSALAGKPARVLLALRAGGMDSPQLIERFGDGILSVVGKLSAQGLVASSHNGTGCVYRLTPAGLAACPARRHLEGAEA